MAKTKAPCIVVICGSVWNEVWLPWDTVEMTLQFFVGDNPINWLTVLDQMEVVL
jgi:hypothetical protein